MTRRRRHRTATLVALVAFSAAALACEPEDAANPAGAGMDPAVRSGALVLAVDLRGGQQWTASGPLVERRAFCSAGARHYLSFLEPATRNKLTRTAVAERHREAQAERVPADLTEVVEFSCFDGSGSFVSEANVARKTWTVVRGTGVYSGLSGSGTISWQPTEQGGPSTLFVEAEIQLRADR